MTLPEALEACRAAGAELVLDAQGPLLRGKVEPHVVDALRQHRERVVAVLRLRRLHEEMGFDATDIALIEAALVSGQVGDVIITAAPRGVVA